MLTPLLEFISNLLCSLLIFKAFAMGTFNRSRSLRPSLARQISIRALLLIAIYIYVRNHWEEKNAEYKKYLDSRWKIIKMKDLQLDLFERVKNLDSIVRAFTERNVDGSEKIDKGMQKMEWKSEEARLTFPCIISLIVNVTDGSSGNFMLFDSMSIPSLDASLCFVYTFNCYLICWLYRRFLFCRLLSFVWYQTLF